jgi:hypothetical protein
MRSGIAAVVIIVLLAGIAWRLHTAVPEKPPPPVEIEYLLEVDHPGSPETVVKEVLEPLEHKCAALAHLTGLTSVARHGHASVRLRFDAEPEGLAALGDFRRVGSDTRRLYLLVQGDLPATVAGQWLTSQFLAHLPKGVEALHVCAPEPAVVVELDPQRLRAAGVTAVAVQDALANAPHAPEPLREVPLTNNLKLGDVAVVQDFVRPDACFVRGAGAGVELALKMGTPIDVIDAALKELPAGLRVTKFVPEGAAELTTTDPAPVLEAALKRLQQSPQTAQAVLELRSEPQPLGTFINHARFVWATQGDGDGDLQRELSALHAERAEARQRVEARAPPLKVTRIIAPALADSTLALLAPAAPNLPARPGEPPAVVRIARGAKLEDIDVSAGAPLSTLARVEVVEEPRQIVRMNPQAKP